MIPYLCARGVFLLFAAKLSGEAAIVVSIAAKQLNFAANHRKKSSGTQGSNITTEWGKRNKHNSCLDSCLLNKFLLNLSLLKERLATNKESND